MKHLLVVPLCCAFDLSHVFTTVFGGGCRQILVESSVGEGTTFRAPLIVATGKPPSLGVPDSRQDDLNACRFIERDDDSFQTPKPGPMTQTDFASAFAKPEELIARASAAAIRPRRNSPPGVSAVQGEPLHGLRVLVVEDSKTIRMVAERLLRRSGCQVVCVENGLEALDAVASSMVRVRPKLSGRPCSFWYQCHFLNRLLRALVLQGLNQVQVRCCAHGLPHAAAWRSGRNAGACGRARRSCAGDHRSHREYHGRCNDGMCVNFCAL